MYSREKFLFAAALLLLCAAQLKPAGAQSDWLSQRQVEFAKFRAANPNPDAAIADLKAKTAALVTASGAPVTDLTAPPAVRRVPGAAAELWDDPLAPQMVIIPAGSFTLGSPASEQGRVANEGPQRRINIATPFAVGKYPITRDEYAAFVAETKRPNGATCYTLGASDFAVATTGFQQGIGFNWRNPGFAQTGRDPVVCVSWSDAQAYVAWISAKTGQKYRLLSETEWEYAARAGTTTPRYWGDTANYDAANFGATGAAAASVGGFTQGADRWMTTAPVGSFPPNAFGLYDMVGNVSQWVQDCYTGGYAVPATGLPVECNARLTRGASWAQQPIYTRVAWRHPAPGTQNRSALAGFRVARNL